MGFLNDIPGDSAILYDDKEVDIGFNLVSSNWVDYKSFTLHPMAEHLTPVLAATDGSPITCHGYISGTWTDLNAEHQWTGLMLFVVDAVFAEPGSSAHHHFLLSQTALLWAKHHNSECGALQDVC